MVYAPSQPNLQDVPVKRGDYVESELAERVNNPKLVGDLVEHWLRHAKGRLTVCFTVNVAHSVHIRDEFRGAGVLAEHIDGQTPPEDRKRILAGLAAGTIDIVSNCAVLTEGWDSPEVSCLVLARPTKSLGRYRQMVGRVLRPAHGKTDAVILDHAGAVFQHGFPDDDIVWTLDQDQRADNPAHNARSKERSIPGLTACPECSAIRVEGQPCASCGWHSVAKPKPFEVADGELGEVARDRSVPIHPLDRAIFHRQIAWIAHERGYRAGWISHKYRERFGEWPPNREPAPVRPDAAVRAWVRSRMIAYSKSQRAGQ
jgi:superfamily II DNA or RNA helicase